MSSSFCLYCCDVWLQLLKLVRRTPWDKQSGRQSRVTFQRKHLQIAIVLDFFFFIKAVFCTKKKNYNGNAATVQHHPPCVRSAPAAISGSWTSGALCRPRCPSPGWQVESLEQRLTQAKSVLCWARASQADDVTETLTRRSHPFVSPRNWDLMLELDACLPSAETSGTSWKCCVLISVGPWWGSAQLLLANSVCGQLLPAWVTSCVSITPRSCTKPKYSSLRLYPSQTCEAMQPADWKWRVMIGRRSRPNIIYKKKQLFLEAKTREQLIAGMQDEIFREFQVMCFTQFHENTCKSQLYS